MGTPQWRHDRASHIISDWLDFIAVTVTLPVRTGIHVLLCKASDTLTTTQRFMSISSHSTKRSAHSLDAKHTIVRILMTPKYALLWKSHKPFSFLKAICILNRYLPLLSSGFLLAGTLPMWSDSVCISRAKFTSISYLDLSWCRGAEMIAYWTNST